MLSTVAMPSAVKARARSGLEGAGMVPPPRVIGRRRSTSSMLASSAMPSTSSSAQPRVPTSLVPSPALPLRGRTARGRFLSLVPLNAFDRDTYRRAPASPPPLTTEQPPPPPPPPPPRNNNLPAGGGAWIAAFFVGLALWWAFLVSDVPQMLIGAEDGFSYIKTDGGNKVLIAEDEAGRTFLVDQDGNLYYDSGIEEVGWYIVAASDGQVTNLFYDELNDGKLSRRVVGNIKDLRQVDAEALAGFKLDDLDKEEFMAGTDDATEMGTIVGFAGKEGQEGDDGDFDSQLPPNAPLSRGRDGALKGPAVLEEGELDLKQKKQGAKLKMREGDRLDQLVSLFNSAVESGAVGAAVGNPLAEGYGVPPGFPAEVLEKGAK